MVFGFFLIFTGLLIAVYPPLLSLFLAFLMIIAGVFLIFLSYSYKKIARTSDDPMMRFFIRF